MAAAASATPDLSLTWIDLVWVDQQVQHWIRFGPVAVDQALDRRRRQVGFLPGAVFACVRWSANRRGTVASHLAIVQAVSRAAACTTFFGVQPGGLLLARLTGWPRVRQALAAIDAVEAAGLNPAEAAPDYWRRLHHRVLARAPVRPYTPERHRASRLRCDLAP